MQAIEHMPIYIHKKCQDRFLSLHARPRHSSTELDDLPRKAEAKGYQLAKKQNKNHTPVGGARLLSQGQLNLQAPLNFISTKHIR
jgi:hypothetical protein